MPHRNQPELEAMRKAVLAALEIRDEADILRSLDRGELEARALQGRRARAAAPPDVSRQLRLTAQAEADAHRQAADAHTRHDRTSAASATALAAQLAAERQRLEAHNARYEQWSSDTHATRHTAEKATAELQRRGQAQPDEEPHARPEDQPQLTTGWWQQPQADTEAVNGADASNNRDPRSPRCVPDMNPPSASRSEPRMSPENEPAQENRAARRIAAQRAERHASSDYAARMELEAQTQAEAGHQAQAREEVELEL